MRRICYFLIMLWMIAFSNALVAQQLKENEIVVIHGEKFVLHQVRTGETIYSISQQFHVDPQELVSYNPSISAGLKIGEILKIPFREGTDWQELPASQRGDPAYFEYYNISSRTETPYFIAKEFGITVEEIYAYNPEITRFKIGTRLRIPRWEPTEKVEEEPVTKKSSPEEREERNLIMHEVQPGETLYSLARKYNVQESEILFFNPGAKELKAGSVIYLPAVGEPEERDELEKQEEYADPEFTEKPAGRMNYFEHTIASGETLWSVTREYDVTEKELKALNPALRDGFPAGVTIKIPVSDKDMVLAKPLNKEAFMKHQVQAGETLFGLASKYHMTIPQIRKFNPQLENRNLVQGEVLLIPRQPEEETVDAEDEPVDSLRIDISPLESDYYEIEIPTVIPKKCQTRSNSFLSSAVCDVALFLPLFIHTNDTLNEIPPPAEVAADSVMLADEMAELENDTVVELEKSRQTFHRFHRESENFMQFYEGVLLAVDSLQRAGMNIRLNVFDSQQNPDSIREHIYTREFLETDLIIGPVYPQVQEEVASIASKNRIPMISPLSSRPDYLDSNPSYFQVNPSRSFLALKTAELVEEEYFNSNFIVVRSNHSEGSTENRVIDLIREKMIHSGYWGGADGMNFQTYHFSREEPFDMAPLLSNEKENVIFIASMNEGDISLILSNINNLADEYVFTLIGFNRYEQFHSISEEFFHNLRLQYVAPYWTDYQHPGTVEILRKFKQTFQTEPDNFGMQGYDVTFYFLSALMHYGKDFTECLPYHQAHLTQGNYRFEKVSQYGGYMNRGVSVISYRKNYEVIRRRIIGPWRYAQETNTDARSVDLSSD